MMTWAKREDGDQGNRRPSTWIGQGVDANFVRQPQSSRIPTKSYLDCTSEAPVREQDECCCSKWDEGSHGRFESVEGYHRSVAKREHIESVAEGVWGV